MNEASKIVSSAVLGMDVGTCVVRSKAYFIQPPTIKKLAGAGYYLADVANGDNIKDLLMSLTNDNVAHALSWMIKGDDSLFNEFNEAPFEEVVEALDTAFSLISTKNFLRLSALTRSIGMLIARQKPSETPVS